MIRILLADDHAILRDGIRALLSREADLCVVGEAGNGQQLLELLATTPVDVVVMDINMPVLDGFATMPFLREQFPAVRVLVLSMLDHENYVHRMLEAGALGYVLKNADSTEITHAIRTVAASRPFLCTEIGLSLLDRLMERMPAAAVPASAGTTDGSINANRADLSGRELEVLQLIAEGYTNAEISEKLFYQQAHHRNPPPEHHRENPGQEHGRSHSPRHDGRPH